MSGSDWLVLVVEDEAPIRRFLKTALEAQGFKIAGGPHRQPKPWPWPHPIIPISSSWTWDFPISMAWRSSERIRELVPHPHYCYLGPGQGYRESGGPGRRRG